MFCYCGIIGFGLQFYFAWGFHYYLYLEPFGILLTLLVLCEEDKPILNRIKWAIALWTIVFSLYKTYKCRVYNWYLSQYKNIREEQVLTAKEIGSIIPPNSCIWVTNGEQFIYLLTGTLPPNLSTIGFSFGPLGINEEKSLKQAMDATFVVSDTSEKFLYADKILDYLKQYQSYPVNGTTMVIYDKRVQIK